MRSFIKTNNFQLRVLSLVVSLLSLFCVGLLNIPGAALNQPNVLGVVTGKEGYKLRYSKTTNGGIVFTGNTLCLAENVDYGSCGTYTSLNSNKSDPDFSPKTNSTTADWKENGGFTQLNIPDESKVLYAELIWGGNYKYLDKSVQSELGSSVTLGLPNGKSTSISPVADTAGEVQESSSYVRTSGDISSLIGEGGKGKYTVSGLPSVMVKGNPYNNYVGFTLAVVYYNQNEPARNLSLFTAAEQVGPDQFTNTAEVKGFTTPISGAVSGKLLVSAQEGDSMYSGDRLKFGPSPSNLQDLQGPNNKVDNFFASQINDNNGYLDTTGSFGTNNQKLNSNKIGARQGWDVTAVNIGNKLTNKQNSAYAKATSTGDTYLINALGVQIEVNSAQPKITLQMEPQVGSCDNNLVQISINVTNNGLATSQGNILNNIVPEGFVLKDNKISINDKTTTLDGNNSIKLPDLNYQEGLTLKYTLENKSSQTKISKNPEFSYQYTMVEGTQPITESMDVSTESINLAQTCKPNQPPIAVNDSSFNRKNVDQEIDILKNDSDAESALSYKNVTITTEPSNGTLALQDNQVIYTPNKDYTGSDIFNYKVCDEQKLCDEAKVDVQVVDILAVTDSASLNVAETKPIKVLDNDIFKGDVYDLKSLKITSQPINGDAIIDVNTGIINYTSTKPDASSDVFEYEICLLNSKFCSKTDVKIDITKIPLIPPVASPDSVSTDESKPVIVDILKNDIAGEGQLVPSSILLTKPSSNGSVEINLQNGELQYSPKPGFSGTDLLSYKVCNQSNLCSSTDVNIIVKAAPQVLGVSEKTATPAKNVIVEALKPLPQVLGISELVRSGGKNSGLAIGFAALTILGAGTFVWLSLTPEGGKNNKLKALKKIMKI